MIPEAASGLRCREVKGRLPEVCSLSHCLDLHSHLRFHRDEPRSLRSSGAGQGGHTRIQDSSMNLKYNTSNGGNHADRQAWWVFAPGFLVLCPLTQLPFCHCCDHVHSVGFQF